MADIGNYSSWFYRQFLVTEANYKTQRFTTINQQLNSLYKKVTFDLIFKNFFMKSHDFFNI